MLWVVLVLLLVVVVGGWIRSAAERARNEDKR